MSYEKTTNNDFSHIETEADNTEVYEEHLDYEYAPVEPRTYNSSIDVLKDSTGKSETMGSSKDFRDLFFDRLEKVKGQLMKRNFDDPVIDFKYAGPEKGGRDVTLIGIVREVRDTQSDNRLIILDDSTGEAVTICTDEQMFEDVDELMYDEIVAIEGTIADDGGIVFVNELHQPEIPYTNSLSRTDEPAKAVFISDIHVGAEKFATERWHKFVDWVRQTPDISYIVCAGDLIEGVGIFPDQEDELSLTQLDDQYRMCGELFHAFPDDVEIVTCTGNHDAVRVAEPQPALKEKHQKYFPDNVTFTSNPSTVKLHGKTIVELYHGVSIHDFTDTITEADEDDPTDAMVEMLQRRHLAPEFGNNARIAPELEDYHVLEKIPDVLHSGHVHTYGSEKHRSVRLFNTGGWVYQTAYQERMNIQPTVGKVTVMDLSTGVFEEKQFDS